MSFPNISRTRTLYLKTRHLRRGVGGDILIKQGDQDASGMYSSLSSVPCQMGPCAGQSHPWGFVDGDSTEKESSKQGDSPVLSGFL